MPRRFDAVLDKTPVLVIDERLTKAVSLTGREPASRIGLERRGVRHFAQLPVAPSGWIESALVVVLGLGGVRAERTPSETTLMTVPRASPVMTSAAQAFPPSRTSFSDRPDPESWVTVTTVGVAWRANAPGE